MAAMAKPRLFNLLPLLIGLAAFFWITGGDIIIPTNTAWMMGGDPSAYLLGWEYFRHTPLWQWPLGLSPAYGMANSSSIVYTDSLPLFALLFKPLNPLLPEDFQYFGIWVALCFTLQAWFSWRILTKFTANRWLPLIGCMFFVIAPIALWRVSGHYMLFGQWVLLAGFHFYFCQGFRLRSWFVLLFCVPLIHAYLTPMVLAIFLADLIQRRWLGQQTLLAVTGYLGAALALTLMVMWAAGYFVFESTPQIGGYETNRMNVLSPINAIGNWSQAMDPLDHTDGEAEGFNYLGFGMLGLALVVFYLRFRDGRLNVRRARIVPLGIVATALFLFALTTHAYIGDIRFLAYDYPPWLEPLQGVYRVAGRFFWPVYYLIYLAIFYSLLHRLSPRVNIALWSFLLVLQIVDSKEAFESIGHVQDRRVSWENPMQSEAWATLGTYHDKLYLVLPENRQADILPISYFAAKNRLAFNSGHFARVDETVLNRENLKLIQALIAGELEPGALYIFYEQRLWNYVINHAGPDDFFARIDDYLVFAPGYLACEECPALEIESGAPMLGFETGFQRLDLTRRNVDTFKLIGGWGETVEGHGTGSVLKKAYALLQLKENVSSDLALIIEGEAYLKEDYPTQRIEVAVNGETIGEMVYEYEDPEKLRTLVVPQALLEAADGKLLLEFSFITAQTPKSLGHSGDPRPLALSLTSIQLLPLEETGNAGDGSLATGKNGVADGS